MAALQVRPDDCDGFGHVNNSVYASFVQLAVTEALRTAGIACDWTGRADAFWWVQSLSMEYRRATSYGETLDAHPWLEAAGPDGLVFGCEIRCGGETRARTRSCWQPRLRSGGSPAPVAAPLLAALPARPGTPAKPPARFTAAPDLRTYHSQRRPLLADQDPFGGVHLRTIYTWLEEAVLDASAQGGWPLERWLAEGFLVLQARHDTEFFAAVRPHDGVDITCRLVDTRRPMGVWLVEVRRQGEPDLLLRDYSTGVYLDLTGRPAAPPPQIGSDLQGIGQSGPE